MSKYSSTTRPSSSLDQTSRNDSEHDQNQTVEVPITAVPRYSSPRSKYDRQQQASFMDSRSVRQDLLCVLPGTCLSRILNRFFLSQSQTSLLSNVFALYEERLLKYTIFLLEGHACSMVTSTFSDSRFLFGSTDLCDTFP